VNELQIRYDVLFAQMNHVRMVLTMIETYLYESHGMIAEREGENARRDGVVVSCYAPTA
jgi:hypothetical protein